MASTRDESAEYREQAKTIGRYLADYRAMSEYTVAEVACLVGATEETWHAWMSGKRKPAPKYARRIEKIFPGMAEVFAFHGTGNPWPRRRRDAVTAPARGAQQSKQASKRRASSMTAAAKRRRLYLIEERHRVMQARRKREERNANEQEA
jgi:DNA-binding XRE family transcriptional regulator